MASEGSEFGSRGEGWVAGQMLLLAGIMMSGIRGHGWRRRSIPQRLLIAVPAALGGVYLFLGGGGKLGRQLTPFPKPVQDGELQREGAYGLVRHPIYGGVLLLTLAWSMVSSPRALRPWVAAALFLDAKRRQEEAWLAEQHPDYDDYRRQVPHSFVPHVW